MSFATLRPRRHTTTDRAAITLDESQIQDASQRFKLISDPPRLRILSILSQGELSVTALCKVLGKAQPAVSHHLSLLRLSGLIHGERRGRKIYYSLGEIGWALLRGCRLQFPEGEPIGGPEIR